MRRTLPFLVVSLLALTSACQITPDTWTYSWTRKAYGTPQGWLTPPSPGYPSYTQSQPCGNQGMVLLAIYLLPVIVDTVMLPVTVTHDLRMEKQRRLATSAPTAQDSTEPEVHGP